MAKVGSGMTKAASPIKAGKAKPASVNVRSTGDGGNLITRLAKKGGGNKGKMGC